MRLYRLAKLAYSRDLTGKGAEISGGRWNSKGVAMLYTAQSIALATTEIAVHVPLGILPKGYTVITFQIPDSVIALELEPARLPTDWKSLPYSFSTQLIGDEFIKAESSLILKVPSAVVQGDYNYLLNPKHHDMKEVSILSVEPYEFDKRLFFK